MPQIYDLHMHSTASDGTLTPEQLVQKATTTDIKVLALTDHDTTDGLSAAASAIKNTDITLINGVEISVSWYHLTIHVVGLHINPNHPELHQGLTKAVEFRQWRAQEIATRLEKSGIANTYSEAKSYATGNIISRTHFARCLVARGLCKDVRSVFKKYLIRNKLGHVPGSWANLEKVLSWIHGAGGIAIIAHPARYKMTLTKLRQLVSDFKVYGGQAIEVVSGSHSRDDAFKIAKLANDFNLYGSCGSDYHGPTNPYLELGRLPLLPENCKPIWESDEWIKNR